MDKLCYYFNKLWLDFGGRTLEQELGNRLAANVHPDDRDRCLQVYASNFNAVQQLHREIRTACYLLHPPLLDEAGLNSALSSYEQGVTQRSGIAIDFSFSADFGRLSADMELAISPGRAGMPN